MRIRSPTSLGTRPSSVICDNGFFYRHAVTTDRSRRGTCLRDAGSAMQRSAWSRIAIRSMSSQRQIEGDDDYQPERKARAIAQREHDGVVVQLHAVAEEPNAHQPERKQSRNGV